MLVIVLKIFFLNVWDFLQKLFSVSQPIFYGASTILVIWTLYKSFIWLLLWILRERLKKANLDTFKKILGQTYKIKKIDDGEKRYKWSKGLFIVKANFDNYGGLICNHIEPFKFWTLRSELSFV